jgi:NTP pyrophosphatase (non-canonical NTP hydrolase)
LDDTQPPLSGLDVPPATPRTQRRRDLTVRSLGRWCESQIGWIARKGHLDRTSDLFIYTQAAKLMEEVGELHAQLLGRSALQRKDKLAEFSQAALGAELADVVICTTILAQALGVDLAQALEDKINVVDDRLASAKDAKRVAPPSVRRIGSF